MVDLKDFMGILLVVCMNFLRTRLCLDTETDRPKTLVLVCANNLSKATWSEFICFGHTDQMAMLKIALFSNKSFPSVSTTSVS